MTKLLLISSYVCLMIGNLSCAIAALSPYWFFMKYYGDAHFGIFFATDGKQFRLTKVYPDVVPIPYGLGLLICLINTILSSVQVCCLKSTNYKLCYASGFLGLLTASLLAVSLIYFLVYIDIKIVEWGFILAIASAIVILGASISYLVVGRKEQLTAKLP